MLPKGHLGFLSLMLNTQTTQVPLHSGCSFKKGNTKGQMHKALTEKLFPKTEVGSNKYSLLCSEQMPLSFSTQVNLVSQFYYWCHHCTWKTQSRATTLLYMRQFCARGRERTDLRHKAYNLSVRQATDKIT